MKEEGNKGAFGPERVAHLNAMRAMMERSGLHGAGARSGTDSRLTNAMHLEERVKPFHEEFAKQGR